MNTLHTNTSLQNGKYIIKKVLGQGGFGITYLAEHSLLGTEVAIKEFFMKDFCNRDLTTSHVTVGTDNSRLQVQRFREKFIKEARNIARLHHHNIIRISDVFEENDTAYYVMDYCEGGSLAEQVKLHPEGLEESLALKYIHQVASALEHIHERKMNHLDVKPANILLDAPGNAILIDFGLSKQYDLNGGQTSTSPVGISHGYAPIEQYKQGGVRVFSPSTDIYSLGATLYKLITGQTPPDAQILVEDNLPSFKASKGVSDAIVMSMQVRRQDRPQSIREFINLLDSTDVSNVSVGDNASFCVDEDTENTLVEISEDYDNGVTDKGGNKGQGYFPKEDTNVKNQIKEDDVAILNSYNNSNAEENVDCDGGEYKEGIENSKKSAKNYHIWFYLILVTTFIFTFYKCNKSSIEVDEPKSGDAVDTTKVVESGETKDETKLVKFSSSPKDAEVFLDGKIIAKTPFSTSIKYGKHTVTITKDGYQSDTKTIVIDSYWENDYFVTLKSNKEEDELSSHSNDNAALTRYNVSIKSNAPKTTVWLDGNYVGYDLPTTIKLEKGRHSIFAESSGYKRKEMSFYVERQNQVISIEFVKDNDQAYSGSSSSSQITVRGTIKDSKGNPISGTVVNTKSSGKTGVSDRNGNFEIKGAIQGETLTVITAEKTYTKTASSTVSFVLNVEPTTPVYTEFVVRGTIKDSKGNPISGTVVNAKTSGKKGVSDRNGNFEIKGATQGETLTVITAEKTYTKTASSTVSFVINVEPTTPGYKELVVRGTIKDSKGNPISETVVNAKTSGKKGVSDRNGNFEIIGAYQGEALSVVTAEKTYTQPASSNVSFIINQSGSQLITVNGKVVDKKGEPMIGTLIKISGTNIGTIADVDGNFTLGNVPNDAMIEFSFVGYKKQKVPATSSMRIVMRYR